MSMRGLEVSLEQQEQSEQRPLEDYSSAELCRHLEALSSRDWQLWSICALVIVIIAIGFAAFVVPNLVWPISSCELIRGICRNSSPASSPSSSFSTFTFSSRKGS